VQTGVKVGLLEDQSLLREALAWFLSANGCEVLFAAATADAFLRHADRQQPSVVLVDPYLEADEPPPPRPLTENGHGPAEPSGLRVLRQLQKWHPEIKALVLSGSRDPVDIQRAMDSGASGYVDKNSEGLEGLAAAVHAVSRGDRLFPLNGDLFSRAREAPEPSSSEGASMLQRLTLREREVLRYVGTGADNIKIAALLSITERTVRAHVSNLYRKLGSENRAELALLANRMSFPSVGDSRGPPE
jgi:two-component system nitrate/nitrite response regulator NarL